MTTNEASLILTYSPNPSSNCLYDSYDGWVWTADIEIKESIGIAVKLGNYSPEGYCCKTELYSSGSNVRKYNYTANDVEVWFGTLEIPAYGSVSESNASFILGNYTDGYVIETYYGKDMNGNIVSCSKTLYLENPNKGKE